MPGSAEEYDPYRRLDYCRAILYQKASGQRIFLSRTAGQMIDNSSKSDGWADEDRASVVACFGHMVDAPNRPSPRFPASSEKMVAAAIQEQLAACNASVGVVSLASGADILFAEALLDRGAEVHLVLPLNIEEFLEASVRPSGDDRWENRFHAVRARATSEEIHGDDYLAGSGTPFQLAALFIDGKAKVLSADKNLRMRSICVWDGKRGDGLGGTSSFVAHCLAQNRVIYAIDPMDAHGFVPRLPQVNQINQYTWATRRTGATILEHRLLACLFADAKGMGGLRETQIPAFARTIFGIVSNAINESGVRPLVLNTWGDGLFVATESPFQCADIALRLLEHASKVDFAAEGLPGHITFRIGLHAGPAFFTSSDPLTKQPNAYGREVNRAARIEPITDLGQAWASRVFVILNAALNGDALAFDDLGQRTLPKDAGSMHLYRVKRQA